MKYIIIVFAIILIVILFLLITNSKSKGRKGEKEISQILKKQKGKLINSLKLPLYNNITEIDHVLITQKGIFVIETKNISGTVCGYINDKDLTHKIGRKTHSLYNPVLQNRTHCDNLIHHLKKGGLYPVQIYSVVVFAADDIYYDIKGKSDTVILKKSELTSYINSRKYSPDKTDVKNIYRYLKSINQKNPFKLLIHNIKIKSKK